MKPNKHKSTSNNRSSIRMVSTGQNVLSEHELLLIRETAKLTENLYVKMVCDQLAMEKILRLIR